MAHLSLLSRAGLSLTVLAQPGLQARVEALVQVSELRHLIENSLDLTTGQNWLGGPGGGPQSLHGLEQKIKQVKCWWQKKVRKKKNCEHSFAFQSVTRVNFDTYTQTAAK